MKKISEVKENIIVTRQTKGAENQNFYGYIGGYNLKDITNTKTANFIEKHGQEVYNKVLEVRYNLNGCNSLWLSKDLKVCFAYVDASNNSKGQNKYEKIASIKGNGWVRVLISFDVANLTGNTSIENIKDCVIYENLTEFTAKLNEYQIEKVEKSSKKGGKKNVA